MLVVAGVCVITFIISHLIPAIRRGYWRVTAPAMLSWIISPATGTGPATVRTVLPLRQRLFQGDLGTSIRTGRPVLEEFAYFSRRRWNWLFVPCCWHSYWHPAGHTLCSLAKSLAGSSVRIMAITGISTPAFWLGLGVLCCFMVICKFFPAAEGLMTAGSTNARYRLLSARCAA